MVIFAFQSGVSPKQAYLVGPEKYDSCVKLFDKTLFIL
jgi:hypothetical protein